LFLFLHLTFCRPRSGGDVGHADHGATRIASALSLACIHSPIVVAHATRSSAARSFPVLNDDFNEKFDRFTRGIVRRKISQLMGRAGLTTQDRQDLEQDFFARILQSLRLFNPDVAHRNKFITAVVERYVANILRDKKATKRDHRRISSLNVPIGIGDEELTELAQTISDRELDARLGRKRLREDELAQLAIDLADVIATLPEDWRTLLELRKSQTMPEIANELGVPRTTLNTWVQHIRQRFEKGGLRDYLK
jgi:RNA polymerase sigma-70 factor (ECF subfamily)